MIFLTLFPLLLVLLAGIVIRGLLQFGFRITGFRTAAAFVFGERLGAMLLLLCADVVALIVWWYPKYVMDHNAVPDDRFGFIVLGGFPFYIIGFGIAAVGLFRLLSTVIRRWHGFQMAFWLSLGAF